MTTPETDHPDLRWEHPLGFLVGLAAAAAVVLAVFFVAVAIGARITGRQLVPRTRGTLYRTLAIEGGLLTVFALLWLVGGDPEEDSALTVALLVLGAFAMGLQAAVSLAFHVPNIATVAITATLAQIAALAGWRRREGHPIAADIPSLPLMVSVCLAYLISALIVAAVGESSVMAFGPLVLLAAAVAIEARPAAVASAAWPSLRP